MTGRSKPTTAGQLRLALSRPWVQILDGDVTALQLYERHYSCRQYADGRKRRLFVGPGEKMVLTTPENDAIFVWRKFIDGAIPKQRGVNCATFRNEAPERYLSSDLIRAATEWAWSRWPGERLYTYVNPSKIREKRDPGRCFRRAGWQECGHTRGGLVILELFPAARLRKDAP